MQRILIPLDGSELATQVFPYAQTMGRLLSARLSLLHIISEAQRKHFFRHHPEIAHATSEAPLPESTAAGEMDERIFPVLRAYAEEYLNPIAEDLRKEGMDVEVDVLFGAPAGCIVESARHKGATMIAMVTHGYSGLRRWALGSVTDRVVHAAERPVFVVRGSDPPLATSSALRRILVPLDGSDCARQALPLATQFAIQARAQLHLVHAIAPLGEQPTLIRASMSASLFADTLGKTRAWAATHLNDTANELRQQGLDVLIHLIEGHPAEVIIEEARQLQSDMIVMATHGYSGIQRWTLGSVTDKVLHATTTPLLIVQAQETQS